MIGIFLSGILILLNLIQFETWSLKGKIDEKKKVKKMLKVETAKWHQTPEELRDIAVKANHPRTRERLMGLYEITQGKNATQVGRETGRNPQTVMDWVHRYNNEGTQALEYRHSGGHPPLCPKK